MNGSAFDTYCSRLRKVLEYIDAHLDDNLSIDRLSNVAAFSKYHFHRQFSELFEISVYKYIQLTRLKRASYQLAFRHQIPIVDIALASGYENHESFSRAFKKRIGQTPSEFRERPQWNPWHLIYQPLSDLRSKHMKPDHQAETVKVISFPETKVAVLEHCGDPNLIETSIRKFIEWRHQNHLTPQISATFNILYNDPSETSPEDFRLDICASTEWDVADNSFGVVEKTIPAGRCAVLRHIGNDANLGESITHLYSKWLPSSGEEPRDFPLFLQRVKFFPDVPEHEAVIDVFLPLK
ncbi:AraC family transcriptional regulator [Chroococcidiopsis sp. CCALA 051]|uniref:AraC family transcriptional regulator n=1 Tax=Chroococcidiopsis sp. CCALA 051 TaxID=869949 RepID=UPI000D0CC0D7|nr:AraC family transcriptional regulator [Chroococcidiopsis sp. CCALA 051]PSM50117.1 AraC family transcriptional regulator [Chroococcidiopsis sp. CCALA 051]